MNEVNQKLIEIIKTGVDITFIDDDFDNKVIQIIEDAIPYLRSIFGMAEEDEIDWTEPSIERRLLKNYCLYELNNVSDRFSTAYQSEILQVREKNEVKQWKKANSITT